MTFYELIKKVQHIEYAIGGMGVPILKDGNEVNLDFHIVSEEGVVKHIEMIEDESKLSRAHV